MSHQIKGSIRKVEPTWDGWRKKYKITLHYRSSKHSDKLILSKNTVYELIGKEDLAKERDSIEKEMKERRRMIRSLETKERVKEFRERIRALHDRLKVINRKLDNFEDLKGRFVVIHID